MSKKFTPRAGGSSKGKRFGSKTAGSGRRGRSANDNKDDKEPGFGHYKKEFKPFGNRNEKKSAGAPRGGARKPYGNDGEEQKSGERTRKPYGKTDSDKKTYSSGSRERKPYSKDGDDKKPYSSGSRERKPYSKDGDDKKPYSSGSRERKPYSKDADDKKPYTSGSRERKPYSKDGDDKKPYSSGSRERKPYSKDGDGKKPYSSGSRERKPYSKDGDDKKPYSSGSRERKPYSKDGDGKKPYSSGSRERKPYSKDGDDKRSFRSKEGSSRSFNVDGEDKSADFSENSRKPASKTEERSTYKSYKKTDFKSVKSSSDKKKTFDDFDDKDFDNLPDDFNEDDIKPLKALRSDIKEKKEKKEKVAGNYSKTRSEEGLIRLNKYIANAGICSRREADDLIKSGVVAVNGKTVTEMGYKVGPDDVINYGGQTLKKERPVYVLLNKPKDYITTMDDPDGRKNVLELVKGACRERIYPVGRLDRSTTGLLLFTNDGEITKKLTHPRYGIKKIYHVVLDSNIKKGDMKTLLDGITLEDGEIKADAIDYVGDGKLKNEVGVEIHSGRNRIIRRMFEHMGYKVVKLDRVYFAGLTKKNLSRGQWRYLTENELSMLKMMASE